jgi:hypothetical protein
MSIHRRLLSKMLFTVAALTWVATAPQSWANDNAKAVPLSTTKMIIEFNATDNDVGVQVLLDGESWKKMAIISPNGRQLLAIEGTSSLRKQGLTELFFESSEPSLDDLPLAEFLARFPEEAYTFKGETIEGLQLRGEVMFTHVIPAAPVMVAPVSPNAALPVVDPDNFVIEWKRVRKSITGSRDIDIVGYQVIVEQPDPRRVLSIDLPAASARVKIPSEFFKQRNTLHKFEVLAIEVSGNQTITAGEFMTAP